MVCMDSQKAECKVFLKSDHKIKEKGRCRQKELHLLISFGGKICYNKSIAWQRKCDGDKRKCHARDEMPEDSEAQNAIRDLNGATYEGRQMVVKEALPRN